MIIDTHIHLSHFLYNGEFPYLSLDDDSYIIQRGTREQLVERFMAEGIEFCIDPAIDIESNCGVLSLAERFPGFLFTAIGVHPTRTYQYKVVGKDGKGLVMKLPWKRRSQLENLSDHPSVVAIGETGLDYHLARKEQHRFRQKMWFIYQLKLAHMKRLPVILHIRDADADAIRILSRYKHCIHGGVCHCFSGSAENARCYTNLGLMLGIGGSLLIDSPKKQALEQAVMSTSIENILLETDGPYVKPDCPNIQKKQMRKARNTSMILPVVAKRIAELKHLRVEEVLQSTSENAIRLFGLIPDGCESNVQ
ncbi:MAG: TatD family hydrolase [Acutalibacteraceae bacterium]